MFLVVLENVIVHVLKVTSYAHNIDVFIKLNHGYDRSSLSYTGIENDAYTIGDIGMVMIIVTLVNKTN